MFLLCCKSEIALSWFLFHNLFIALGMYPALIHSQLRKKKEWLVLFPLICMEPVAARSFTSQDGYFKKRFTRAFSPCVSSELCLLKLHCKSDASLLDAACVFKGIYKLHVHKHARRRIQHDVSKQRWFHLMDGLFSRPAHRPVFTGLWCRSTTWRWQFLCFIPPSSPAWLPGSTGLSPDTRMYAGLAHSSVPRILKLPLWIITFIFIFKQKENCIPAFV